MSQDWRLIPRHYYLIRKRSIDLLGMVFTSNEVVK